MPSASRADAAGPFKLESYLINAGKLFLPNAMLLCNFKFLECFGKFVGAFLLSQCMVASSSFAQGTGEEKLRVGMSLNNARKILLEGGWQPSFNRWQDKKGCYPDVCKLPETTSCIPTGTGACYLKYRDINNRELILEVNGRGDPRLIRFNYLKNK